MLSNESKLLTPGQEFFINDDGNSTDGADSTNNGEDEELRSFFQGTMNELEFMIDNHA